MTYTRRLAVIPLEVFVIMTGPLFAESATSRLEKLACRGTDLEPGEKPHSTMSCTRTVMPS